jgi:hypothetical protein
MRKNLVDLVLLFLGVTFVYAGVLTLSQNDVLAAVSALVGVILAIKPLVSFVRAAKDWFNQRSWGRTSRELKVKSRKRSSGQKKGKTPTYH